MGLPGFMLALLLPASPRVNPGGMRPGGAGARWVRASWGLRLVRPCPAVGRVPEPRRARRPAGAGLTRGEAGRCWRLRRVLAGLRSRQVARVVAG